MKKPGTTGVTPAGCGHSGNVIFIILIAIALFAGLGFAVSQRSSVSMTNEQAKIAQVETAQCLLAVNTAVKKLKRLSRCSDAEISYELPNGSGENPLNPSDTSCFVFHPEGAGIAACGPYLAAGCDSAILQSLAVGGVGCGHLVYAGTSGGNRLYTTLADTGTGVSFNNDTWDGSYSNCYAQSTTDGLANTNALVAVDPSDNYAPFAAATSCRALGPEWYLPATTELGVLYDNRNTGALAGSFASDKYWSSRQAADCNNGYAFDFAAGNTTNRGPTNNYYVRCVRR